MSCAIHLRLRVDTVNHVSSLLILEIPQEKHLTVDHFSSLISDIDENAHKNPLPVLNPTPVSFVPRLTKRCRPAES